MCCQSDCNQFRRSFSILFILLLFSFSFLSILVSFLSFSFVWSFLFIHSSFFSFFFVCLIQLEWTEKNSDPSSSHMTPLVKSELRSYDSFTRNSAVVPRLAMTRHFLKGTVFQFRHSTGKNGKIVLLKLYCKTYCELTSCFFPFFSFSFLVPPKVAT